MKAGSLAVAALVSLAAAQPHRHGAHQHPKRQAVVTDVTYVTATADNVVVYVDQNGNPVATSYADQAQVAAATPAPAAAVNAQAVSAPAAKVAAAAAPAAVASNNKNSGTVNGVQAAAVKNKKHHKNKHTTTAAAPASSSTSDVDINGIGIAYSPYNADGTCKSQSQVQTDLNGISQYPLVRLYGTDCNQVANVLATKPSGMKLFLGIFDISATASEAATIISAVNGDWSSIDTVSVGNELLNQGAATSGQLVAAINTAKATLTPAGYSGPVVYVDTFNAMIAHNAISQDLCEASDYSAANAHAFFDPNTVASDAGTWAAQQAKLVAASCPGKKVVITESGYPSAGSTNGLAVPSPANQAAAIASLKENFADGGLILFSAYNDLWKANAQWNFFAEQSYGIYGNSPSS